MGTCGLFEIRSSLDSVYRSRTRFAMNCLVRMKIPITVGVDVPVPTLTFSRWLPLEQSERLVLREGSLEASLWFDVKSTWWGDQPTEEELVKWVNVGANFIYADVNAQDVPGDLYEYIRNRDYSRVPSAGEEAFEADARRLAESMVRVTLLAYNRMIAYIRAAKGQYWYTRIPLSADRQSSWKEAMYYLPFNTEDTYKMKKFVSNEVW